MCTERWWCKDTGGSGIYLQAKQTGSEEAYLPDLDLKVPKVASKWLGLLSPAALWLFALQFTSRSIMFIFFYKYTLSIFNQGLDSCNVVTYISSLNSVILRSFLFSWTENEPRVIHLINNGIFDANGNYPLTSFIFLSFLDRLMF